VIEARTCSTVKGNPVSRRSALLLATAIGGGITGYSRVRPDDERAAETGDPDGGQAQRAPTTERTETAEPETPSQEPATSYRDVVVDEPFEVYEWLDESSGITDAKSFSVATMVPAAEYSSTYTLRKTVGGTTETLQRLRIDYDRERYVDSRIANPVGDWSRFVPHRRRSYVDADGEYLDYVSRGIEVKREREFREGQSRRFGSDNVEGRLTEIRTGIRRVVDAVKTGEPRLERSIEVPITDVRDGGSIRVHRDERRMPVRDVSGTIVFDSCSFDPSSQLFGSASPVALRRITVEGRTADEDVPVTASVGVRTGAVDIDEPDWIEPIRSREEGSS